MRIQKIGATGDGKSAVATPDGKKPKEEEEEECYKCHHLGAYVRCSSVSCFC